MFNARERLAARTLGQGELHLYTGQCTRAASAESFEGRECGKASRVDDEASRTLHEGI